MRLPFFTASALATLVFTALGESALPFGSNPVLPGADPHGLFIGSTFWVYPTWSDSPERQAFFAFSHDASPGSTWKRHGPVLDFAGIPWIPADGAPRHYAWAPSVLVHQGRYFLYYSVGPQHPKPSRIGVAVGDRPEGPFRDSGKPLITGDDSFEAIDPMAFDDAVSGKTYLYAGGSASARLRVYELKSTLTEVAHEIQVETPPKFTEGAFMHQRQGRYYLSYSHGNWQRSSYSVHYATAITPLGPWTYRGAILTSDETHKGPGHHSFVQQPGSGQWLIVYHRWEDQTGDGPYQGSRQVCIDLLDYDANGLIQPIKLTGR